MLTLENPNLWKLFGSEPRLSVSESSECSECSESEKPGGGARARGRLSGAGAGAGQTEGREDGWAEEGGGGGTPPYISTSFRPC